VPQVGRFIAFEMKFLNHRIERKRDRADIAARRLRC
jgi:hypothetical protein